MTEYQEDPGWRYFRLKLKVEDTCSIKTHKCTECTCLVVLEFLNRIQRVFNFERK